MKKRLLSFVLAVLMIASLLPATALAADIVDSGTCGAEGDGSNLTWTLDSDGVLTISGSGDMYDYSLSGAPWYGIRSRVKSAVIADGVTSIGYKAFDDCTSLTSVTIPDSVTSIGEYAFYNCSSLTSVAIPDSVTSIGYEAFFNCTSLTSVTIPDSVTSIGADAFWGCESLTSVTIPGSVTSIGVGAFASCTSLTGIWVAEGSSHYSSDASGVLFNKDMTTLVQCPGAFAAYTIPDSVTSIGGSAFRGCSSLTSVTIPDSVTSIGEWAFSGCDNLTDVYYTGTEIAWNKIKISDYNDALKNATIHYFSEWTREKEPTCTEPGSETSVCPEAGCGKTFTREIPALGHSWDEGKVTKPATEAETGVKTFTCTRCGETKTETIPKLTHEHNYNAVVTAPTCTEKGYTTHTCACGDSYVDTYVDALGHAWDNGKVTKQPTETETGVKTFTCTRCGETKTEVIPATGIVASGTCGAEGDGSNLTWTLDSDGVLTISGSGDMHGYGSSDAPWHGRVKSAVIADGVTSIGGKAFFDCTSLTSVTIPDSVTSIGKQAFMYCTSLTGVTIPDSVTSIGEFAFFGCSSLASVTIPNNVTSIGEYAFYNCSSLTSVTIPNSVTSIGEYAFYNCKSLTSVAIPDSVTSIGEYAFYNCRSLTSVTIPDSVTSIGDDAFSNCKSLTSVTIPDSVTSIGNFAFSYCESLTSVTIPDSVTSIGDNTFDGCTSLTSVTIPNSVTSIGKGAFSNCKSLTSVTIPGSVTRIGVGAFASCTSLTSVTIPDSVTSINNGAFYDCSSLTDVYYAGSEAQWKAISISSNRNDDLLTANIHYNYGSHTHSYKDVVTAPTCTEKGYTTHTCACGDSYMDTYVDALGHAWDNGKVTKEPTETETGVKTFTCTRCGETKTETIPKLAHEHSYDAVVTAPTCTEKGYTTHTCACGDSYVDTYTDALGHAWDNGKVTKEPTETESGVKTFTCTRCGETKTESIPVVSVDVTEMFSDVTKNWAYPGIQYCVTHKLMGSTGGDKFAPTMTTTRAQIVQILYNLEGEPKVSGTTPFTDLTQDWYQDAVLWAYQTGVVAGTSSTTFEPDLPVTREQIAVILMEYMTRVLKLERTWTPADLSGFPDAASVSDWAKDAMADAVALGLISGASNGGQTYLNPQGSATREQVATILMEFCKNVKK